MNITRLSQISSICIFVTFSLIAAAFSYSDTERLVKIFMVLGFIALILNQAITYLTNTFSSHLESSEQIELINLRKIRDDLMANKVISKELLELSQGQSIYSDELYHTLHGFNRPTSVAKASGNLNALQKK